MRHEVVVEGVELLQQHIAARTLFEKVEQPADGILELADVEFGGGRVHHILEIPPDVLIDLALMLAKPFVDHVFEEFQVAVTDPDLEHSEPLQSRNEVERNLPIALQQESMRIGRLRDRPREDHPRLNSVDWNSEHYRNASKEFLPAKRIPASAADQAQQFIARCRQKPRVASM